MKSLEELREWTHTHTVNCSDNRIALVAIADSIESDMLGLINFHDRLCDAASNREDVTLFGTDYIALPVDADGETIRPGDEIEHMTGVRDIVRFLTLNREGWIVNERGWKPCTICHHHAPTVEDVLRAFWSDVDLAVADCGDPSSIIAEYAAKLRLAGDAE